jgi:transketolase
VPEGAKSHLRESLERRGKELQRAWRKLREDYHTKHPDLARELAQILAGKLPENWDATIPNFPADSKGMATRAASGKVLNAIAERYPWLIGGAADLAPSTKTTLTFSGAGNFEAGKYGGRNLHFGIREHVMGAVLNGLALSHLRPYGATFLIFSDYMKPPIRLSALMELPVVFIFTHDSIGLGEDGPTHQPIEQLISLRAIPGMIVLRPSDANEVAAAWRVIVALKDRPACLVLTRQPLPTIDRTTYAPAAGLARGAYVMADAKEQPEIIVIGTGSEISVCLKAYEALKADGIGARLVSMPSWELFEQQEQAYRDSVLPPAVTARVSVEAASVAGWDRYVGVSGAKIGMRSFGASAPIADLMKRFHFTAEDVVAAARDQLGGARQ